LMPAIKSGVNYRAPSAGSCHPAGGAGWRCGGPHHPLSAALISGVAPLAAREIGRESVAVCGPDEAVVLDAEIVELRAVEGADMVDHEIIVRWRSLHL
jgi:hypothetical protein